MATELGETYSDQDTGFQFRKWVAEGVAELFEFAEWFFTGESDSVVTVAGTAAYPLPDDCGSIRYLVDEATGDRLTGVRADELIRGGHLLTTQGVPAYWFLSDFDPATAVVSVQLYPVPSAVKTYTLHYTKLPPELEDEADVLPVPFDVIRTLREAVRKRYYENADQVGLADKAQERFQLGLLALQKRYQNSPGLDRQVRYTDLPRPRARLPMPRFPRTIT